MSADITPENVAKTLARLRATKRPTAKMTAEQDGPGGPWVHKTVYETDPESASDADLLEALASRVAELEAEFAMARTDADTLRGQFRAAEAENARLRTPAGAAEVLLASYRANVRHNFADLSQEDRNVSIIFSAAKDELCALAAREAGK